MDEDYSFSQVSNIFNDVLGGNDDRRCCMIDFQGNIQLQRQPMPQQQPNQLSPHMMHFADFGPKMVLSQTKNQEDQEAPVDPVHFRKFPVLNEEEHLMSRYNDVVMKEVKGKRKRARTSKTREEVESQRMIHIAVERNRRKQMNEHLRVLRSLMPGSYVQRGDQASIIGGVIEFIRELEQLLQCLESQKRRRILEESSYNRLKENMITPTNTSSSLITMVPNQTQPVISIENVTDLESGEGLHHEERAEKKSCLADVEVELLGFDAMIKILSRRRPGQLIKTIAALEDLHLSILHTNITTMEQTVLYSFNTKIASETRFTADDIASSIQEIFSFIHASTTITI